MKFGVEIFYKYRCWLILYYSCVYIFSYVFLCLKYYECNSGKDNFKVMFYLLAGDTNSGNKLVICIMLIYDFP